MIRPNVIWGIARAEMRLTRRLARFWVFFVLAALFAVVNFAQFAFIHWQFSAFNASAAATYPRYFMGSFGTQFTLLFLFGLIFLGFDLRARDVRERMVEVLDSLPCTNVELLLGKFVGLLIPAWVATLIMTAVIAIAAAFNTPLEPLSVIGFLLFMALPAFTFAIGLVYLLTLLLRHRLLASVVAFAVFATMFIAALWWVPIGYISWVDVTGGYSMPFPSDTIRTIIDFAGFLQRAGFAVVGFGLILLAAAVHPRLDDGSRPMRAGIGAALVVAGFAFCSYTVLRNREISSNRAVWIAAHEARDGDAVPDVLTVSGDVAVRPGDGIEAALSMSFRAREGESLDTALFALNPGLTVASVKSASGSDLSFTHEDGLLDVTLGSTLRSGEETRIDVAYAGMPDSAYAYLDATLDPLKVTPTEAQIFLLGYEPVLLTKRFFALLPGVRWLPASGPEIGRGDPERRPADFFEVELDVETPDGFLVAGPGKRQEIEGGKFRFAPGGPVPGVALVGSTNYVSHVEELDGLRLELLLHRTHQDNLPVLEDATGEIRDWVTEKLADAAEYGLDYPYDGFTMAEVPNVLRGYGGGWRMDTTLSQPGMVLLRESGFPTANFERAFRNPEQYADQEGGLPRRKRQVLEAFFENDFNGGNPFVAASRSFFNYQTAGKGESGVPLDYVFENLATRLITEKQGYFSVYMFDQDFGQAFAQAGGMLQNPDRIGETYADVLIHMLTSRPEVWNTVLEESLVDLDPWEDPDKTIDVLSLKGTAMAQSMLDGLGREKAGQLLAAVRERRSGGAYTRADVAETGAELGEDLESWLTVWLDETALPGFTVNSVNIERLADSEDGTPRYQSLVVLRNDEDVPGLVRLDHRIGAGRQRNERGSSEPIYVEGNSAVEIGLVTNEPPTALRISPYLALNRDPFNLPLPAIDEESTSDAEPFDGTRPVEWVSDTDQYVVVDDLDPGFEIRDDGGGTGLRVQGRGDDDEMMDAGLPVTDSARRSARWSRMNYPSAYGKYRHTVAVVKSGQGNRKAVFNAELPHTGQWELWFHLQPRPSWKRGSSTLGTWNLQIDAPSGPVTVSFDADNAEPGWNLLGTYDLDGGEVSLVISNETEGKFVVADAVRWAPVKPDAGKVASLR